MEQEFDFRRLARYGVREIGDAVLQEEALWAMCVRMATVLVYVTCICTIMVPRVRKAMVCLRALGKFDPLIHGAAQQDGGNCRG